MQSYLDVVRPDKNSEEYINYLKNAKENNNKLKKDLAFMYDRIQKIIKQEFNKGSRLHEEFAHPGFHIWGPDWAFEDIVGPIHCDLHYFLLDWKNINFDPKDNISFTVPIKLPKYGGDLFIWDKSFETNPNQSFAENRQRMFDTEVKYEDATLHKHQIGYVFFHSGNQFHQVETMRDMDNDDQRMTFQGHAVLDKERDEYILFW